MRSMCPESGANTGLPTTPPVPKSNAAWKCPTRYSPKPPVTFSGGASGGLPSGASNGTGGRSAAADAGADAGADGGVAGAGGGVAAPPSTAAAAMKLSVERSRALPWSMTPPGSSRRRRDRASGYHHHLPLHTVRSALELRDVETRVHLIPGVVAAVPHHHATETRPGVERSQLPPREIEDADHLARSHT